MDITAELTIVIPLRIDCTERKYNLDAILLYLSSYTNAKIILMEVDNKQNFYPKKQYKRIGYYFKKDSNDIFHYTKYRNELLLLTETKIVAIWDVDIFVNLSQIKRAVESIKKGLTMCIPYDGRAFYLNPDESIKARKNINNYLHNYKEGTLKPILGRPSVGGTFIVNIERYLRTGGENENFYGWGPEDAERLKRMEILQEPVGRIEGPLFHLHHPRNINSTLVDDERNRNNVKEFIKICRMNNDEIRKYIDRWSIFNRTDS